MTKSIRNAVEKYIGYKVDDALNGEQWTNEESVSDRDWLLGWQCGFEPVFVVCRSYLSDATLDRSDAIEYAIDYLKEIGWFSEPENDNWPDFELEPLTGEFSTIHPDEK